MLKWGPQDPNFGSGAKVSGPHMSIRDLKEPGLERREGRTLGRGLFGANCYLSPAGSVRILHARGGYDSFISHLVRTFSAREPLRAVFHTPATLLAERAALWVSRHL